MTAPTEHLVAAKDLVNQSGISYRQMDYWVRTGRLTPVPADDIFGSGYPRYFPPEQIALARAMKQLIDAGLSVPVAHTAAQQLVVDGHADLAGFTLTPHPAQPQGATP